MQAKYKGAEICFNIFRLKKKIKLTKSDNNLKNVLQNEQKIIKHNNLILWSYIK